MSQTGGRPRLATIIVGKVVINNSSMMRGFVSATYAATCLAREGRRVSSADERAISWTSTQEKATMTIARMQVDTANHTEKVRMIRT